MAKYRLSTPQGNVLVEAPEGASKAEVIRRYNSAVAYDLGEVARKGQASIRAQLQGERELAEATALSREPGVLDYFGEVPKGVVGGAANLLEQGALGLATLLPESAELVVRDGIQSVGGAVQDYVSPDINLGDSVPRKLSEAIGSFAGIVGTSLINPILGATTAVSAGVGEASERARAGGATQEQRNLAALQGVIPGALELIPASRLVKGIKQVYKGTAKPVEVITNRILRATREGGFEAGQEVASSIAQNMIEQGYNPEQDTVEGYKEAAGYGGAVGFLAQGLLDLVTPRTRGGASAIDSDALPEGIAGLLPAPKIPPTRQLQDSTSGETIPMPAPPKRLTGPDDLGLTVDARGQARTRDQKAAEREAGMQAVEQARQELRTTGEVSSETMQKLRTAPIPMEAVASVLENTRNGVFDLPGSGVAPQSSAPEGGLRGIAGMQERARLAEETDTLDQMLAEDMTQTASANVRRGQAAQTQEDIDARAAQELENRKVEAQRQLEAASAVETAQGKQDTDRLKATEATRTRVLQDTVTKASTGEVRRPEALRKMYETALTEAGITNSKATPQEMDSLRRASSVIRAKAPEGITPITEPAVIDVPAPIDPQQRDMEARVAPKVRPEVQESLPTLGRKAALGTPPMRPGQDTFAATPAEAQAAPIIIDKAFMDSLAIPPNAPIRKRVMDKDFNDPAIRQQFSTFAGNKNTSGAAKQNINRKLADTPAAQADLPLFKNARRAPDAKRTDSAGDRAGTTGAGPSSASSASRGSKTDSSPRKPAAPDDSGVGPTVSSDGVVSDRAETVSDSLNKSETNVTLPPLKSLSPKQTADIDALAKKESDTRKANFALARALKDAAAKKAAAQATTTAKKAAPQATTTAKKAAPKKAAASKVVTKQSDKDKAEAELIKDYVLARKGLKGRELERLTVALMSDLKALGISNPPKRVSDILVRLGQLNLPSDLTLEFPVANDVAAAVESGDLKGALEALAATTPDAKVARIAKKLAANIGDTKIIVKKNLKAEDGSKVSGYFDPETNTIALDADTGISTHPLLHEVLHAATSATIANKSHPLTKRLNTLFESVKDQLAGEYGITSLDEFVAESLSNPEFQTRLKTTVANGKNPWQQLVRAVSNFVRRMLGLDTKSDKSTLDTVDEIVQAMISPTYDGRIATKLYMKARTPDGAREAINDLSANTFNARGAKNLYDYLQLGKSFLASNIPVAVKKVYLKLQPVNILGELAKSDIPMATQLNKIINRMSTELRDRNQSLQPIVDDLRAYRSKLPEQYKILKSLVPIASHQRLDPRVADFNKANGRDKTKEGYNEEESRAMHKELHRQYKSLSKEGQDLYKVLTNMFEANTAEVMKSIDENLAATITDAATRKKAVDKLAELLNMDRGVIRPFAPLTRKGDFRLSYNTVDPQTGTVELYTEYFKTERAREKAKRNLKKYNDEVLAKLPKNDKRRAYILQKWEEGTASTVADFSKAPPDSFVYDVLQTLKANNVDQGTIDSIAALALDTMPERSFMQSFRKRGDVRGFLGDKTPTGMAEESFDLIDMVQTKGRDYNRQIVQMKYGAKLQAFKNELNEFAPAKTSSTEVGLLRDTLEKIATFAQRPTTPRWSQMATSGGYAWTMGANLSSAAITTFDVFMSTAPRLMGKYGDLAAMRAMGTASAILFKSPKTKMVKAMGPDGKMTNREVNTGIAGFSMSNYDFDDPNISSELKDIGILSEVATENAQINQTLNTEQLEMGNKEDALEKINAINSFLFHHAERYNREVALIATYTLELQRMRDKKGSALSLEEKRTAAEFAVSEAELALGATASAGRPVFAQGGIGNVAMLFKRFAISKYYMMAHMTNEAFQGGSDAETKENRRIAQHQLGRFLVSTGLFAGVAGMPLMGAIGEIYDLFADEEDDNFDSMLRKTVGEGLYNGIVNEALGVEVASRIGMNSLLYRPPIIEKDQAQLWTLLEQLGGPAVGIYLSIDRGIGLFGEGEFVKGVEAVSPAAVRNVIKGGKQLYTGDITTRRGDAVVEDIGLGQILAQFGGFANADLIKQYQINKNERRKSTYLKTERTRLLRLANMAAAQRDTAGYRDALRKIQQYNRDMPRSEGRKLLIMPDTIKKSRRAFDKRTSNMIGGIEYTPSMRRSLREYDQGIQLFD